MDERLVNEGREREIELENGKNGGKGKRLGSGRKRYFLLEYFFFLNSIIN